MIEEMSRLDTVKAAEEPCVFTGWTAGAAKVIMATNRIESLDPAMIRPGAPSQFSEHVQSFTLNVASCCSFRHSCRFNCDHTWPLLTAQCSCIRIFHQFSRRGVVCLSVTMLCSRPPQAQAALTERLNFRFQMRRQSGASSRSIRLGLKSLFRRNRGLLFGKAFFFGDRRTCRGKMTLADDVNLEEFVVAKEQTMPLPTARKALFGHWTH